MNLLMTINKRWTKPVIVSDISSLINIIVVTQKSFFPGKLLIASIQLRRLNNVMSINKAVLGLKTRNSFQISNWEKLRLSQVQLQRQLMGDCGNSPVLSPRFKSLILRYEISYWHRLVKGQMNPQLSRIAELILTSDLVIVREKWWEISQIQFEELVFLNNNKKKI